MEPLEGGINVLDAHPDAGLFPVSLLFFAGERNLFAPFFRQGRVLMQLLKTLIATVRKDSGFLMHAHF